MNKKSFLERSKAILANTNESPEGLLIDLQNDISSFLNNKLHEQNKNKCALAIDLKMKQSQLTRILNAEENITLKTIVRLYIAFGCKPRIINEIIPKYETAVVTGGTSTYQFININTPKTVTRSAMI